MSRFEFQQPTKIIFGTGEVARVGAIASEYGQKCILVTVPEFEALSPLYKQVKASLTNAGVECIHFDGVIPNPTTDIIAKGAKLAVEFGAQVVVGLGGGSSMDAAKAIAVEASHDGSAWDYLFYKKAPTEATLPIIAVSTTSGTGSQTTQCSVVTKTEDKCKSAIWHPNVYPRVAIVDPQVMLTLPASMTAATGFDVFAHSFEGYISRGASPYTEMLSLEAIKLVAKYLPRAVKDGQDLQAREGMAYADTLAGTVITNAGVTLPHGIGMQIGGHCPHVAHGVALAVFYPEFTRYTYKSSVKKFATVARIFNTEFKNVSDEEAAEACCVIIDLFLKEIDMWKGLKSLNISMEEIRDIANDGQVLDDYKNNPKVATIEEMYDMLVNCYERA